MNEKAKTLIDLKVAAISVLKVAEAMEVSAEYADRLSAEDLQTHFEALSDEMRGEIHKIKEILPKLKS